MSIFDPIEDQIDEDEYGIFQFLTEDEEREVGVYMVCMLFPAIMAGGDFYKLYTVANRLWGEVLRYQKLAQKKPPTEADVDRLLKDTEQ